MIDGPAGRLLVDRSAAADLVIVGARRRIVRFGLQLGRVTHTLLHRAACPVAVVPQWTLRGHRRAMAGRQLRRGQAGPGPTQRASAAPRRRAAPKPAGQPVRAARVSSRSVALG
ncbi:universal stress protein [Streptomyces griseosporeus]|uniref:universal stress protein n=1 Tax=Streptomyces griseosporeus TaxID=1910 RepID=UPI0037BDAA95